MPITVTLRYRAAGVPVAVNNQIMVSNKALARVALYGGVVALGAGFWVKSQIEGRIKDSEYFKTAMSQLRTHRGAVSLLGEPIIDGSLDLGDSEHNHCDGLIAQFHVPVKGPQDRGILHFWAKRDSSKTPWHVVRSELELKSDSSKRLVLVRQNESDGS